MKLILAKKAKLGLVGSLRSMPTSEPEHARANIFDEALVNEF